MIHGPYNIKYKKQHVTKKFNRSGNFPVAYGREVRFNNTTAKCGLTAFIGCQIYILQVFLLNKFVP